MPAVDEVYYEEISVKVMNILQAHADCLEQAGLDEAFLDVTEKTEGSFESAGKLAQTVKDDLRNQLGLTCSIGVGQNKLVAKIAADSQKPNGLTIVKPEQMSAFLSPLPISRLIGVGLKTAEKMRILEINTVEELARFDVQKLIAVFGRSLGIYFHNCALGIDEEPVQERGEAESISRISTLKENIPDLETIMEKADQLCREIHAIVIQQKLAFRTLTISAVMQDMGGHTRSRTLENSTSELETMKKVVKELFVGFLSETELDVRRVGIKVSGLVRGQEKQRQLASFMDSADSGLEREP